MRKLCTNIKKTLETKYTQECNSNVAMPEMHNSYSFDGTRNHKPVTTKQSIILAKHPSSYALVKMYETFSDSWSATYVATSRLEEFKQTRFGGPSKTNQFMFLDPFALEKYCFAS